MAARIIEIFGVVGPTGGGGSARAPFTRNVQFSKWRTVGEAICDTPLCVQESCEEKDIRPWMRTIKPGDMLRMEIALTKALVPEQMRGRVVRYFGKDRSDGELRSAAADKRPRTLDVPGFGTLRLNSQHDSYETTISLGRHKIAFEVVSDKPKIVAALCAKFAAMDVGSTEFQASVAEVLERDLLPLKNESWLDDGEKPMTAAKIRKAFRMQEVQVFPKGTFDLLFDDGAAFQGHDVVVRGKLGVGPQHADLHG